MKRILQKILLFMLLISNHVFAEQSVAFFYGQHVPIPELCLYKLVIVDPESDFLPQDDCKSLSEPIAYASLGEVRKGVFYEKGIRSEWVIGTNVAWNHSKIMDQTSKGWQEYFLDKVIDPLWHAGYRGFFLDTLDSYFLATHDSASQQKQIDGLIDTIQKIKKRYPSAKIILNRGFQLLPRIHSDVDAVVIESLYHAWNQKNNAYELTPKATQQELLGRINAIKQMQLPIIIIDYLPPNEQYKAPELAKKIAEQGLIPWITNNNLQEIYINQKSTSSRAIPQKIPMARKVLLVMAEDNTLPLPYLSSVRFLGSILEYMGYVPEYINYNVTKILPQTQKNSEQQYAGVIFWLEKESAENKQLFAWIHQQITLKIPIVFLYGFGVPIESAELGKLGLSVLETTSTTRSLEVSKIDKQVIGFETDPIKTPYDFFSLRANGADVLLQMKNESQQTMDAVVITQWGGYALINYVIKFLPNMDGLWVINPFAFFQKALRLQDFPVPDTTTENGRRLMTVHIDGDGFSYVSKWLGGRFSGIELREKILNQFPIPTAVSVITGEIGPDGVHPKEAPVLMNVARSIFALPFVEMASHSFSHPFNWESNRHNVPFLEGEPFQLHIPGYRFNLDTEITGSVDFINRNLAPTNKKCQLMFWSGMADPSIQALAVANHDHLLNINGVSDTHLDFHHPSLTGLRPMGIRYGEYYQVFAPIDMDFYYTHSFAGPLYGFKNVIQTFELTDKPRRFKPIDIYYHFYAASNIASLEALKSVYQWALKQSVMNIYISDYIKKVLDYYQLTIMKYTDDSWIIYTKGELRELRSPNRLGYPDLQNSQNVIGFKENKEDIYIHLGPNRFTLLKYQKDKPKNPFLIEANARVTRYTTAPNHSVIAFKGYMPLEFTLANVKGCHVTSQFPLQSIINKNNTIQYRSSKDFDEIHISC